MAKLRMDGMEEAINDLERLGKNTDEATTAMLRAAGNVMSNAWRESAEKHHHRDTGQMIASISAGRKIKGRGSGKSIVVTPQGKDHKGVRNAEKAFILHYGTGKIAASHWVDEAEKDAEPKIATTMQSIWNEYIATGTVRQISATNLRNEQKAANEYAAAKYHGPGKSEARSAANRRRKRTNLTKTGGGKYNSRYEWEKRDKGKRG